LGEGKGKGKGKVDMEGEERRGEDKLLVWDDVVVNLNLLDTGRKEEKNKRIKIDVWTSW
jgi:hypothetical protein